MSYGPLKSQLRRDQNVENILQAYTNDNYLADKIFPTVTVQKDSGYIPGISNDHLRIFKTERSAYDEKGHRMQYSYESTDTYKIKYHDMDKFISDQLIGQEDKPFNLRRDAAIVLREALMLERENTIAAALTDTNVVTQNTTLSGTSQFTDEVNSNPISVIETARDTIQAAIGREANKMIIGRAVFNQLKKHPAFADKIAGSNRRLSGSLLKEMLMDFFELDEVFVASTIKVTSNEGQTETKGSVWGNDILLYNAPSSASLFAPAFGYSFMQASDAIKVQTFRHPEETGEIVRVSVGYDDNVLDVNAGYLIKDAV